MKPATGTAEPTVPVPGSAPETRRGARLVLILGALSTFAPLSIDMYLPALPALARDLGAIEAWNGRARLSHAGVGHLPLTGPATTPYHRP